MIALGVRTGDRVAILADTRPEWTIADLAALWAGAVVVPVYASSSPEECAHVLRDSAARLIFCENNHQAAKIEAVRDGLPNLEHVVTFAKEANLRSHWTTSLTAAGRSPTLKSKRGLLR